MDLLLVRRRPLLAPPAPFRCACGNAVTEWNLSLGKSIAKCSLCDRPEYHVLRAEITSDGQAREWVIAARGVVELDKAKFEGQGFHVLMPEGAKFFREVPTITGELTNADGSLKVPTEGAVT